jgi:heme-degrading monooxygenase HmoA
MEVVRTWHAVASPEGFDAYADHFRNQVLADLAAIEGFRGAKLLKRLVPGFDVEITVVTRWRDLDAVLRFAGEDYEKAVVAAEAAAVLISYDPHVTHSFIVVESSG